MADVVYKESGHYSPNDELISLGGVKGVANRGRNVDIRSYTAADAAAHPIAQDNPQRIAMLITNNGTDSVPVDLGNGAAAGYGHILAPGGSLQIDKNFPWTGEMSAYFSAAFTGVLAVTEISVP